VQKVRANICWGSLCEEFSLFEQFVQTAHVAVHESSSCKQFTQTVHMSSSCEQFVQTVCEKSLCKQFMRRVSLCEQFA